MFIKLGVSWSMPLEEDETGRQTGKNSKSYANRKERERLRRGRRKKGMEEENKEGRKRKG